MLYAGAAFWTIGYDTIYAFQDIEDDLKIGVKSSAIKFSSQPRIILASLAIIMFALVFYVGISQRMTFYFYFFTLLAFFYLLFLVIKCDYSSPKLCLSAFKANIVVGILILCAIILG